MMLSHVVAASENNTIGRDGGMPWHLSDDLKRFKQLTMGSILIMGRKTFDSIGKPLPGRYSIVITRDPKVSIPGVKTVCSIEAALAHCEEKASQWGDEIFIVGGGEIYRQTLSATERVYLTRIHQHISGDTAYPELGSEFRECERIEGAAGDLPYSYITYQRQP